MFENPLFLPTVCVSLRVCCCVALEPEEHRAVLRGVCGAQRGAEGTVAGDGVLRCGVSDRPGQGLEGQAVPRGVDLLHLQGDSAGTAPPAQEPRHPQGHQGPERAPHRRRRRQTRCVLPLMSLLPL